MKYILIIRGSSHPSIITMQGRQLQRRTLIYAWLGKLLSDSQRQLYPAAEPLEDTRLE